MKDSIEMSKRSFYIIIGLCAVIIIMVSLETILMVKGNEIFELWKSNPNLVDKVVGSSVEEMYSIYLTMCLSMFFIKIITPIALTINTYFAFVKLRVNKLFVQIWIVLLIGLFAFTAIMENFYSIFFIVSTASYLGLVIVMLYFWVSINKRKNEQVLEELQKL
ncbi:hypothetical protein [Clostridium sp.]|uniref:hypothetical protein n=1 Tax=Clostridium sp. TaxID=1506 RepID=UPI0039933652